MERRTVLTAIGDDRPGLVDEVSEYVFTRGGSIEDSRMANLQGQFVIMVLIAGSDDTAERMEQDLAALGSQTGLLTHLTPAVRRDDEAPAGEHFNLTGEALDQPGLVYQVANVLRTLGANIESMETSLEVAPVTGAPMFSMDLSFRVPEGTSPAFLSDEIARVCGSLNIDWHLAPL